MCVRLAAACAAVSLALGSAEATTTDEAPSAPPPSAPMTVGGPARAPMGFVRFCQLRPGECEATPVVADHGTWVEAAGPGDWAPPVLTVAAWREVERIDAEVDRAIAPATDFATSGTDDSWSLAPRAGDCEDYALTKRHELLGLGWPAHSLLIALVRDDRNRSHAVLVVRTDRGEFVLDNVARRVLPWGALPYRWIKRQSVEDPRRWVKLEGYADEMVRRVEDRLRRLSLRR